MFACSINTFSRLSLLIPLALTALLACDPPQNDPDPTADPQADIVRDEWGVPHIFSEDQTTAMYALGYATAQDRMFQMDFFRRYVAGELSELFWREGESQDGEGF